MFHIILALLFLIKVSSNSIFSTLKLKYIFGIIYHHPRNNVKTFIEALDANLQAFNCFRCQLAGFQLQKCQTFIFGDINIDLNYEIHHTSLNNYSVMLHSNAFSHNQTHSCC